MTINFKISGIAARKIISNISEGKFGNHTSYENSNSIQYYKHNYLQSSVFWLTI